MLLRGLCTTYIQYRLLGWTDELMAIIESVKRVRYFCTVLYSLPNQLKHRIDTNRAVGRSNRCPLLTGGMAHTLDCFKVKLKCKLNHFHDRYNYLYKYK